MVIELKLHNSQNTHTCCHAYRIRLPNSIAIIESPDLCDINNRICPLEANMKCEAYTAQENMKNDNGE